jgi:hypothetical protein
MHGAMNIKWLRMLEIKVLRMLLWPKRDEVTGVEEDYITRNFIICMIVVKYYSGDRIKKNCVGEACDKYVGHERFIQCLVGRPE